MSLVKEREYISNIKGVLIVLVVIGHFMQLLPSEHSGGGIAWQAIVLTIYSFHMPLFVFISGYLSKNDIKRRDKAFEDLLIPYLLFNVIFSIADYIFSGEQVGLSNVFHPEFALWYLLALFLWKVLLPDVKRIKGFLIVAIIANLFTCLFTDMTNVFACQRFVGFFVFFYLGYKTDIQRIKALKIMKIKKSISFSILIVECIAAFMVLWKTNIDYGIPLSFLGHTIRAKADNWFLAVPVYLVLFPLALFNSIQLLNNKGRVGEVYNVGGHNEMRNIDIVKLICKELNKPESLITFVTDRKGHDMRYAIDPTKIHNELGWLPETKFEDGIKKTIKWYLENREWWEEIISGEYQNYYVKMYGNRGIKAQNE